MTWRALCTAAAVVMLAACETGIDAEPAAPPTLVELTTRAAPRCPHCGRIESKREIVPSVADPRSPRIYEYTLRMADGSSRVFREALPASWRVGERLTFIDGRDPALD